MTSVAVPDNDLAPNMPSRVVTISATNVTEGGTTDGGVTIPGKWVNFALSDTLDVTPGGDVIARTSQTVTLDSAGNGQIRLPVYDTSHGKGWERDKDWAIIVTTSWGSSKAIRVPAGSTSIPLSQIPAVRPLSRNEMRYAITGVSVSVSVGSTPGQASGNATLDGGIVRFGFVLPPTGAHKHPASDITDLDDVLEESSFWRPVLTGSENLDQLTTPGIYPMQLNATANSLGIPVANDVNGTLEVTWAGSTSNARQIFRGNPKTYEVWERSSLAQVWSAWKRSPTADTRILGADANLNSLDDGWYAFSGTAIPAALGIPVPASGAAALGYLHQRTAFSGTNYIVQEYRLMSGALLSRSRTAGVWSAWVQQMTPQSRILDSSANLDALDDGWYVFSSTALPATKGIPVAASGVGALGELYQRNNYTNSNYITQEYRLFLSGKVLRRVKNTGTWGAWVEAGASQAIPTNALPLGSRELRVQLFEQAYPLVSTGGKGCVVFRYDHGLTNFKSTLLPLHQQYGIKAYIAMNSRNWGITENSGATQAEAAAWANVEWGNHTSDHNDQTGIAAIYDSVVKGRTELESQLGRIIHGFTVPGLVANGDATGKFDGWGAGDAAGYSSTYAGGLILAQHAVVSGTIGDQLRELDGRNYIGGRHFTWEAAAWADIKAMIDAAAAQKKALTIMCHPRTMGATGYWTAAIAEQVISYVRSLIDAGQLADISYYQSHRATL
ncbi:polysaccharide deacetylase family protein [Brachybacterium sp. NBEC-018]|uniref:polysaccharide deacetylase family protein n=1 Tax=Brachybacterium sp. NBEC-018 TaxID=2996004 RepID=UPI0021752772|nr:polysaccharide deacetylase family protein [Brachybacterium sp. NBEC-018]UVY83787.1 polysaccharide deacetylase family protein [Brachybacterium sp. NBEC-018]